jgi:hypothetical protein
LGIALSYLLVNLFYRSIIMFGFELRLPPTNGNRMAHARINTFWDFGLADLLCGDYPPYIKAEMLSELRVQLCFCHLLYAWVENC